MSSDDDAFWRDPASWKGGVLYYRRDDPRVIVPKRMRIGWTINFAHPKAFPVLVGSMALVAAPAAGTLLVLDAIGVDDWRQLACTVALVVTIFVILLFMLGQRVLRASSGKQ